MRGLYTAGVLDALTDERLYPDYVIGVSAGACNAVSYLSGQRGRNRDINIQFVDDRRYVSLSNFIRTKSVFGMDFIFDEIPDRLMPFDYERFLASPIEFYAGVTDMLRGKPVYFGREHMDHTSVVLRASSAIPLFSPPVEIDGRLYLDGGTTDPIPVRRALRDGCDRLLVVLTRERDYVKQPERFRPVYKRAFTEYPCMTAALDERAGVYNDTLAFLRGLEAEGRALVLAPAQPLGLSRFERDRTALLRAYQKGYDDAARRADEIRALFAGDAEA